MKCTRRASLLAALLLCLAHTAGAATAPAPTTSDLINSCNACHRDGSAAIPGWPPLQALSKKELVGKLTAYRNRLAPESRMSDVTHNFTDAEIEQLATYYSQQSK